MEYTIDDNVLIKAEDNILQEYYLDVHKLPEDYEDNKYVVVNNELVLNDRYEEEKAKEEAERIARLSLTRGDVFRGILKATGKTKVDIRNIIELLPETTPEEIQTKELAKIDFEDSLNFFRGVPIVDILGKQLGFTKDQLDKFFETNDYTVLIPPEPEAKKSKK